MGFYCLVSGFFVALTLASSIADFNPLAAASSFRFAYPCLLLLSYALTLPPRTLDAIAFLKSLA